MSRVSRVGRAALLTIIAAALMAGAGKANPLFVKVPVSGGSSTATGAAAPTIPGAGDAGAAPSADGLEVPVLEVPLVRVPSAVTGMPNGLTPLRPLVTGDESRGWEGVGRLNIGRNAFCSAAMIAPDRILTAAHCLFNEKTGARVALDTLQFLADWRLGRAVAYRTIRRAVVAKGYRYGTTDTLDRVGHDLALLELARPIQTSSVTPFAVGQSVRAGAAVGVVSYARHRADAPSLQRLCHVLTRLDGALMLDCSVDFGASGAPIFTIRDGVASIVSVVSAKARAAGKKVALGTDVAKLLPAMEAELDAGGGGQFLHAPTPESASARAEGIRIFSPAASAQSAPPAPVAGAAEEQSGALIRAGGAKFLRPEGN